MRYLCCPVDYNTNNNLLFNSCCPITPNENPLLMDKRTVEAHDDLKNPLTVDTRVSRTQKPIEIYKTEPKVNTNNIVSRCVFVAMMFALITYLFMYC